MSKGAADTSRLAQVAFDAMGAHARVIPAIIVQGADDPVVRTEARGPVFWITIAQAERRNAINDDVAHGIAASR